MKTVSYHLGMLLQRGVFSRVPKSVFPSLYFFKTCVTVDFSRGGHMQDISKDDRNVFIGS